MIGIDGLAFGRGVQIPARAEKTPRAGDDPHAQRRVLVQTIERGEQRLAGGHVDGVGLGSIQSDRQHAVALLGVDTGVQHSVLLRDGLGAQAPSSRSMAREMMCR